MDLNGASENLAVDFGITWNWEYDADFAALLQQICQQNHLTFLQVNPDTLAHASYVLQQGKLSYRLFLDRASEDDSAFLPFVEWAGQHADYFINRQEHALLACDKAVMHYRLIEAGLYTPHTIVLPPFAEKPHLDAVDLEPLGERFILKPANGSGGEGVVTDVCSLNEILSLRQEHPAQQYLLQTFITPMSVADRPAWFRILYCRDRVYPCWWHPFHHDYAEVSDDERERFGLQELDHIATTIAALTHLDLFSTEVALTQEGLFVVIDYVNDQPDFRQQSTAADGVPDAIVRDIAERLVGLAVTDPKAIQKLKF